MSWEMTALELDEDTDWSFVDTVPEPRWAFAFQNIAVSARGGTPLFAGTANTAASDNDELHWTPGHNGKGLIEMDNTVHTWNCFGAAQEPWHMEYVQEHGLEGLGRIAAFFYIDPDGGVYNLNSGADEDEDTRLRQLLRETDPNLNVGQGGWSFSKTADLDGDVLDWDEGNYGKGIVDRHGNVYTWNEDEWALHRDYEEDHDIQGQFWFTIMPDGAVDSADMTPIGQHLFDVIQEADNRLHLHGDANTVAWNF